MNCTDRKMPNVRHRNDSDDRTVLCQDCVARGLVNCVATQHVRPEKYRIALFFLMCNAAIAHYTLLWRENHLLAFKCRLSRAKTVT